jgi:hypothetical protein
MKVGRKVPIFASNLRALQCIQRHETLSMLKAAKISKFNRPLRERNILFQVLVCTRLNLDYVTLVLN